MLHFLQMRKAPKTHPANVLIFGSIFLFLIVFLFYNFSQAVTLRPEEIIVHTELVYYDGRFSTPKITADTHTALYLLNQSDEVVYATVYEYDKQKREVMTAVQIPARENQFIKTDGPGVVYLVNEEGNSSSTVRFSRWATIKKYTLPSNFGF